MKLRAAIRSLTCLLAVTVAAPIAHAGDWVREVRAGVLAHDVPDLWSGFRVEDDAVAINFEAILSPSLPFLGGNIRPAIGASIATEGGTSDGYIDARWEIETPSGIFFGIGLGAAIHDGETVLSPIWQTKPETASRVKQRIRTVLDWAKAVRQPLFVNGERTVEIGTTAPECAANVGWVSSHAYS